MASKYKNSYHRYYGRSRGSLILKIILVLLALLVVAALVFRFVFGGRIERTEYGLRLVLPGSTAQPSESPQPTESDPILIIEPSDEPTQTPEPSAEPLRGVKAVEVTADQLRAGTALQAVRDAGGDTLVVTMKGRTGRLLWQSHVGLAADLGVNAADDGVAQAVAALAESGEVRLVARVNCFRDQALVRARLGGPLMTRGGNVWYDQAGLCWVSATDSTVRSYLAALCAELADMGFDEILLESPAFPDAGEVHVLAEGDRFPADKTAPAEQFLSEVCTALEGKNVTLSVLTTAEAVLGANTGSGVTAELLASCVDRAWMPAPAAGQDPAAALEAAGLAGEGRLVLVGDRTAASWADLNNI